MRLQEANLDLTFQLGRDMQLRENASIANICAYMREYRTYAPTCGMRIGKKLHMGNPFYS